MLKITKSTIINHHSSFKRATALLLVVVLLAILAIMGTTFVISTRIEKVAADNQQKGFQTDQAMDSVLAIIQNTLSEDLWDVPEDPTNTTSSAAMNRLRLLGLHANNDGATSTASLPPKVKNEPWDAPTTDGNAIYYYFDGTDWKTAKINVDGDPWLAGTGTYDSGNNRWTWEQVTKLPLASYNTSPKYGPNVTSDDTHLYADADGDGYNDSNWQVLPVNGPNGTTYRVACRIIDTCGMVNVNTAWAIPSEYTTTPSNFLGNTFAGVNLYNTNLGYNNDGSHDLPGRPAGSTLATMLFYQQHYIFKIESPDWTSLGSFYPLDLSDELELRYKWDTDDQNLKTTLETSFTGLQNTTPPHQLLRRSYLTAYSFSRNIRRESVATTTTQDLNFPAAYNLEATIEDLINVVHGGTITDYDRLHLFVRCIRNAFDADTNTSDYADNTADANYHTWQYIANLIDYLDSDDIPTALDTTNTTLRNALGGTTPTPVLSAVPTSRSFDASQKVYGLEKHAVISEIGFLCTAYNTTTSQGTYNLYVELHNPWATPVTAGNKMTIYINGIAHNISVTPSSLNAGKFQTLNTGQTLTFSGTPPTIQIRAISYTTQGSTDIPEDVFGEPTSLTLGVTPSTLLSAAHSLQKNTSVVWSALTCKCGAGTSNNTLGFPNTNDWSGTVNPCGYATVTTSKTLADTWCDPTDATLWKTIGTVTFAKLRNISDLIAVPYLGYMKESGVQKGIGDWLIAGNDATVHFDFTDKGIYKNPTPDKKAGILRDRLFEAFKLLDRADDGINQYGGDGPNEMRLPGLININTAPSQVLQALHDYVSQTVGNNISGTSNKPYKTTGQTVTLVPAGADDFFITGLHGNKDVVENSTKWSRFANLITNRSDTFCAYILLEALDANGNTVSRRREIVLFDRSMCNQPPLIWDDNGTPANTSDDYWNVNPNYRKPEIVARQRVE